MGGNQSQVQQQGEDSWQAPPHGPAGEDPAAPLLAASAWATSLSSLVRVELPAESAAASAAPGPETHAAVPALWCISSTAEENPGSPLPQAATHFLFPQTTLFRTLPGTESQVRGLGSPACFCQLGVRKASPGPLAAAVSPGASGGN